MDSQRWQQCWHDLLSGQAAAIRVREGACELLSLDQVQQASADRASGSEPPVVLFSGAFNPLHDGHRQMAQWIQRRQPNRVEFELSVQNVDKPPMEPEDAWERTVQFRSGETVWLTRTPTFAEKSELFQNVTFAVGADTIQRVAVARYYADGLTGRDRAVRNLIQRGCRFLVFGRLVQGVFRDETASSQLPPNLMECCDWVPAHEFRFDISSTEIRNSSPSPPRKSR